MTDAPAPRGLPSAVSAPAPLVSSRNERTWLRVLWRYAALQFVHIHPRLWLVQLLVGLIPRDAFGVVRAYVYRLAGFRIARGARIYGPLTFSGTGPMYGRLHLGEGATLNSPVHIELHADVRIGRRVGIGHHVIIITMNHEFGPASERAGALVPAPVTIGDGAWIGACVTILPGVTIGEGAFVGAGTVVGRSVPPNGRVVSPRLAVAGFFEDSSAGAAPTAAGGATSQPTASP